MRVLVVGTNRICHERLAHHGHDMVLFMRHGRARPADVTGPYQHVIVLSDDADPDLWVDIARADHRRAPFDAVVAYNEHTYAIVHAISEELRIPTVVDVDLFGRVLNKARMREILEKHGVPGCRYRVAAGTESTLAAIGQVGLPCIVKPLDGEASLGVARIGSVAEIDAALQWVGADQVERGVLVEEFLAGEEYSVEAVSTGTRHRIVAITKKFKDERTFVERGHLVPAPLDAATHASIADYVTRILDVLGFHDCPSHTEIVLTDQGPRIIETHNRIGGDSIMDLVHLATGVDMYDLIARQSLGEDVTALLPDPIVPRQYAAIWFADPSGPPTNTLVEVQGIERVAQLPYVDRVEVLRQPGSPQVTVAQSTDRSGMVVVTGDTAQETVDRAREAIGMLRFIYAWNPSAATDR